MWFVKLTEIETESQVEFVIDVRDEYSVLESFVNSRYPNYAIVTIIVCYNWSGEETV